MKRALGYIVLIFLVMIYLVSSSSTVTDKIVEYRGASATPFSYDAYQYGDLFGKSYLSQFQLPSDTLSKTLVLNCDAKPTINLSVICDSYIDFFFLDKSFYCGVDSFNSGLIYDLTPLVVDINPHKKNVLLLEMVERNVRDFFNRTDHVSNLVMLREQQTQGRQDTKRSDISFSAIKDFLFNHMVNTNLEINTWEYAAFRPIKKFKADLNYNLFNAVNGSVALSPDKEYLFYQPTIDSNLSTSSFQSVPESEITSIVDKLNNIYSYCKKLGFDEVYLSIIPNPVSVISPDYNGMTYNRLGARIQHAPGLQMPSIDVYDDLKKSIVRVYKRSDTHWNANGAYTWLNKFNNALAGVKDR